MAVPDARKQFTPLESNPTVFNSLLRSLGAPKPLTFVDVYSLTEPVLLAMIPRPIHALVLILPFDLPTYYSEKQAEDAVQKEYVGDETDDHVCFIRQTIHNACGMWAVLHAVCNGEARKKIRE
jgi:ubiquitin carboxyl-terminal hydrolase L3